MGYKVIPSPVCLKWEGAGYNPITPLIRFHAYSYHNMLHLPFNTLYPPTAVLYIYIAMCTYAASIVYITCLLARGSRLFLYHCPHHCPRCPYCPTSVTTATTTEDYM